MSNWDFINNCLLPYREAVFYINLFYFFGKMFLYMELFAYFCIKIKVMEVKAKFKVVYSKEADDFLNHLPSKDHLQHCQSEVCD